MKIIDYKGYQVDINVVSAFAHDNNNYVIYKLDENNDEGTDKIYISQICEDENTFHFDDIVLEEEWKKVLKLIMRGLTNDVIKFDFRLYSMNKSYVESSLRKSRPLKVSSKFINQLTSDVEDEETSNENDTLQNEQPNNSFAFINSDLPKKDNNDSVSFNNVKDANQMFVKNISIDRKNNVSLDKEVKLPEDEEAHLKNLNSKLELSSIEKELNAAEQLIRNIVNKNNSIRGRKDELERKQKELESLENDIKTRESKILEFKDELDERDTFIIRREQFLEELEKELSKRENELEKDIKRLNKNLEDFNSITQEINQYQD
ncbi:MAG: hypothetical protein ACK5HL_03840 [Bacilli bacterium]